LPVLLALHPGDQQLQMRHHRLSAGSTRFGLLPRRTLGGERRLQRVDIVRHRLGHRHGPDCLMPAIRHAASARG